ncbi:iron ABC transporter permease [Candidatus Endobugula sertula]|uniref:Iron ABC transporter permease n=1 Tax=Candidatus Endobugula sertula TaxID=62101 RepID=A0A1D2QNX8_9GAMM|nr:iron ABC transporter permease [Candidatus Endobugula sertula]
MKVVKQYFSSLSIFSKPLAVLAVVVSLLLTLPVMTVVSQWFHGSFDVWGHLSETVLWGYLVSSWWLSLGVGLGVLMIGVPAAWLTSLCDFPGQRFFTWALLLPLAVPAYIIAYTYTGILDFAGPIQTAIRSWVGIENTPLWLFNIRSLPGAIVMLTLVLYPYVYLLARTAFLEQSASIVEVSKTLGYSYRQTTLHLVLPMARPAIIAGLTLALMETLADFGTVQYFGVSTFTTGIFRAFYGFGDMAAASQLSSVLLGVVILLIVLERYSRRQTRYHTVKGKIAQRIPLTGSKALLAMVACGLPFVLGFLIPAVQLLYWSLVKAEIDKDFVALAWNSFYLAFIASVIAVVLAVVLAYAKRFYQRKRIVVCAASISSMGYALPGTIIAIGVIVPFSWLDHQLIIFAEQWLNIDIGLLFSGTLMVLLFAYTVRFLAVSLGTVDSGLQKIKPHLDQAASLSGYRPLTVLRKIHVPLLRGSLLTALLIVFVDVLKELPATLILRPFNFNTLAVRAYELASDERLIDAAPASLLIVLVGLLPVVLLSRSINYSRQSHINSTSKS